MNKMVHIAKADTVPSVCGRIMSKEMAVPREHFYTTITGVPGPHVLTSYRLCPTCFNDPKYDLYRLAFEF